MTEHPDNVTDFPATRSFRRNGNGGGDFDARLRSLETTVARLDERMESVQQHGATKNDISTLKIWILGGVLSALVAGFVLAGTAIRAFLSGG